VESCIHTARKVIFMTIQNQISLSQTLYSYNLKKVCVQLKIKYAQGYLKIAIMSQYYTAIFFEYDSDKTLAINIFRDHTIILSQVTFEGWRALLIFQTEGNTVFLKTKSINLLAMDWNRNCLLPKG
jgi:hypothetical protein